MAAIGTAGGPRSTRAKKPTVLLVALAIWLALAVLTVWRWADTLQPDLLGLSAVLSGVIWWCTLLWALHHLAFQFGGLLSRASHRPAPTRRRRRQPPVAILYTTCNDFNSDACRSCVDQNYSKTRVLVLDDSPTESEKAKGFCDDHPKASYARRDDPGNGFKAGNLNFAFGMLHDDEWALLVDADQVLPPDYLSQLVPNLPDDPTAVAFVQTANTHGPDDSSSPFQRALSLSVPLYFSRDLRLRGDYGFVPMLGHSVAIHKAIWQIVKEFEPVVSEDFAFAMRAASKGRSGMALEAPVAMECFPHDFGGFLLRLRKYAGGTAELFRGQLGTFLGGQASFVEKWDVVLQLGWYVLMPFITLNGFLGAYVVHGLWAADLPSLHPLLPLVYGLLPLALLCLYASVTDSTVSTLRFYAWSTAIHAAAMPLAGLSFLQHLVHGKPGFETTPKNGERRDLRLGDCVFMVALGLGAMLVAVALWSPFSPVLVGQGAAYLSFPLYGKLCSPGVVGMLTRNLVVYLPAALMLLGLYTMWRAAQPVLW